MSFVRVQHFDVFHLWCEQMKPQAKNKLVVIVGVEPEYVFGFVIDTKPTRHALEPEQAQTVLPCYAPILAIEHDGMLEYDSFVNCRTPYTFPRQMLTQDSKRVSLNLNARKSILHAVKQCRELKPKHRDRILEQISI